jgi:hypothetical protein
VTDAHVVDLGGAEGQRQYLIDRGIKKQNNGGGSVRPAVLCGTNRIYRAGYTKCGGAERGERKSGYKDGSENNNQW